MASDCPATHYVDSGDYAEAIACSLPLEHNADAEPWHQGGWTGDGEDVTVRWRWDKEDLVWRWPPPVDPFAKVWSHDYQQMFMRRILDENVLFNNVTVSEIPATGTRVQWRKWGELPKTTALETTTNHGESAPR